MVKLTVLYPRRDGGTFDMQYYRETHLPLLRRLMGDKLKALTVDEGVEPGALPAPYAVVCELTFESLDVMGPALAEHQPALGADIPKYTSLEPVFQVSNVIDL
jgi:uncharacterized protein (TIGR02118 family)